MRKLFVGLVVSFLLIIPPQVHAGMPLDTVKKHVNNVLEVLRDPALKGDAHKQTKEKKIEDISNEMFDYTALSRLTLSRNWKKFNAEQQKEFIKLYRDILEEAYMDRIMAYTNEKVVFAKETMISEKKAEVQTKIITKSADIPIAYRVYLKDGQWKVYDVIIEGISLIKNYRTQFRDILAKNPPEEVLRILREKVSEA
jgi:phospholipid transport system substrate-binding protein